jgi:hypothetical protein
MEKKPTQGRAQDASEAPLPAERAFVVQLRPQADPGGELFVGRAEHIASGTAARFASADGLIAFITKVLAPPASCAGERSASTGKREKTT